MELTGRAWAAAAAGAVLVIVLLGWNIAQQREIASLRIDVVNLEKRLTDDRTQQVQALSGLAHAVTQPAPPAALPRPARAKAKASTEGAPRTAKARTANPRTGAARTDAARTKAKARRATE